LSRMEDFTMSITTSLMLGVFFSSIGFGYFIYGKKQRVIVPLVVGLALMVFPYMVTNLYLYLLIGIVLLVLPYFVRL